MSSWFPIHRIEWIVETVRIFGFINRDHIMRKFGVSVPQASTDLKVAMAAHPDLMRYNLNSKRYELQDGIPASAIEESMRVVPVDPTALMIAAGAAEWDKFSPGFIGKFDMARSAYGAMLQAFTDTNIEKEAR